MFRGLAIFACALPLMVSSDCGNSDRNRYHLEPAAEWTVCHPEGPGWSEHDWSIGTDQQKWLPYEWSHNCTFPFIGWDAKVTMEEYYRPNDD